MSLARSRAAAVALGLALFAPAGHALQEQEQEQPQPRPAPTAWSARESLAQLVDLSTSGDHGEAQQKATELLSFLAMQRKWAAGEDWRGELEQLLPENAVPEMRAALDQVLGGYESSFELLDDSAWQAELHYAIGVALLRAGDALDVDVGAQAEDAFRVAAAHAGPGDLRLDALYDAGLVHLLEGERRRSEIPELGGAPQAPTVTPPPGAPAPAGAPGLQGEEEPPDPLELARAAYERARAALIVRLRADWRDPDTRANLELIQRRLEELDEIEREREEEQQEEPPQDQDQEQEQSDEENEEEQESQGDEEGEENQEQEPQEGEDEQQPEDEELDGDQQPPEPDPSERESEEGQQPPPPPPTTSEEHLTREEIQRLLDKLEEIEQRADEVRAQVVRKNRVPVEKDW